MLCNYIANCLSEAQMSLIHEKNAKNACDTASLGIIFCWFCPIPCSWRSRSAVAKQPAQQSTSQN